MDAFMMWTNDAQYHMLKAETVEERNARWETCRAAAIAPYADDEHNPLNAIALCNAMLRQYGKEDLEEKIFPKV